MGLYLGDKLISSNLAGGDTNPIGSVIAFAGSNAPVGYLMCDGSAVSRETYADLFAVIGTTYGSGDGSTTFNLPDFKEEYKKLLWTNPNPSSNFAAQTIALDLSGYDEIYIDFIYTTNISEGLLHMPSVRIPVGDLATGRGTFGAQICRRTVYTTNDGVRFDDCERYANYNNTSVTVQNSGMIPYKIYGIKETTPIIKAKQLISVMGTGLADDFVVEEGTSGDWVYRKWNSGKMECFGADTKDITINSAQGGVYTSPEQNVLLPFNDNPIWVASRQVHATITTQTIYLAWVGLNSVGNTSLNWFAIRGNSAGSTVRTYTAEFYLEGRWK